MDRLNVLVSAPSSAEMARRPFLPYIWAILKSHWERHSPDSARVNWLSPIYLRANADALLAAYANQPIDVLALSCYTWNFHLQCEIARCVKGSNPECLVVVGGPEPAYRDPGFFKEHQAIDAIVVKDGEITFSAILSKVLDGSRDFSDIGGLYLPDRDGGPPVSTGQAVVPTVFDFSPYLDQRDYFESIISSGAAPVYSATLESNRGCPYGCSFCDWGSSTLSKFRRFELDRVRSEIDWLAEAGVAVVFLADSNFGVFERDLQIADWIVDAHERHRYPAYFVYSVAKNKPDRSVAISKKLFNAGVVLNHELSIQHTNVDVLAATERRNISSAKQVEVVRALMEDGIPIDVQLILGIPGDTLDLWKHCFSDLMEWGIHEHYTVYPYRLLPNAPVSHPDFMKEWGIETVERRFVTTELEFVDESSDDCRGECIVSTGTFSREDWVEMNMFQSCIKALHCTNAIAPAAIYLRFSLNVSFFDFYDGLYREFLCAISPCRELMGEIRVHYEDFLSNAEAVDYMRLEELSFAIPPVEPYRWLFINLCRDLDGFFDALGGYLNERYPEASGLASLCRFQRQMIVEPTYDRRIGKVIETDLDWPGYFAAVRSVRTDAERVPSPSPAPSPVLRISDQHAFDGVREYQFDWDPDSDPWSVWFDRTVVNHMGARRNTYQNYSWGEEASG